jgi:hypothetical protein
MIGFEREDARASSRLLEAEVLFEPNMAIARRTPAGGCANRVGRAAEH